MERTFLSFGLLLQVFHTMLNTPLSRLRVIGFIEGCSYLVLLFIAMPLKNFAAMPMAVTVVGSLHGALFILFCLSVVEVILRRPWWSMTLRQRVLWSLMFCLITGVASVIPFGTFVLDRWLKRIELSDAVQPAK